MPPSSALRAQLLALAELLPPIGNEVEPLTVIVRRGSTRLRFDFSPEELRGAARHTDLSPMEQALLEAATDRPQSPKTLARLAGYKAESVRKAITSLVRKRLLVRTADGYSRAVPK